MWSHTTGGKQPEIRRQGIEIYNISQKKKVKRTKWKGLSWQYKNTPSGQSDTSTIQEQYKLVRETNSLLKKRDPKIDNRREGYWTPHWRETQWNKLYAILRLRGAGDGRCRMCQAAGDMRAERAGWAIAGRRRWDIAGRLCSLCHDRSGEMRYATICCASAFPFSTPSA